MDVKILASDALCIYNLHTACYGNWCMTTKLLQMSGPAIGLGEVIHENVAKFCLNDRVLDWSLNRGGRYK